MVKYNWAELKYGKRLRKLAKAARDRVRAKHPELAAEMKTRERKDCVWRTLTETDYSTLAWSVGMFLVACIVCSTVAFILETVPAYEMAPGWGDYFFYAECFFVFVFSIEIGLKFWSTPQTTLEFFQDFLNVIDILAILPFYLELFMVIFIGGKVAMWDLRALRAFRLMRMMKMGRFSGDLQLLAEGMYRARVSIGMLFVSLILGTVVFSVLMWVVERGTWSAATQCYSRKNEVTYNGCSPFESVPVGFWWAMTTMTTVGYGDTFPVSPLGRVVGAIAMLAGIFCVALPTGILCAEFSKLYEERHTVRKEVAITAELQMRPKAELELFLDNEKILHMRHDIEEQLVYLKHLAYIYADKRSDPNNTKTKASMKTLQRIDPVYSTFQEQFIEAMDSMRSVVTTVCDELTKVRPYHASVLGRGRSSRSMGAASPKASPRP